jgi:hypothetical protein
MRILFGTSMWLLAGIAVAAPITANQSTTLPGYQNWQAPVVADWRELNRQVATAGSSPDTPVGAAPDPVSSDMPDMRHGDQH